MCPNPRMLRNCFHLSNKFWDEIKTLLKIIHNFLLDNRREIFQSTIRDIQNDVGLIQHQCTAVLGWCFLRVYEALN